ncbi:MAG: nitrogen fixation protein [Aquabacterium sp.]
MNTTPVHTTCPSVQPDTPDAHVFAVVGGTADRPEVAYLDEALPVTPDIWAMTAPLNPAEVLRIAGPCAMSTACMHFDDERRKCRLAIRTVRLAPVVVSKPPRCAIRRSCMWWSQEGVSACLRCPQVITNDAGADARTVATADPHNLGDAA